MKWHDGEEVNAAVCKTAIRGCESLSCLAKFMR